MFHSFYNFTCQFWITAQKKFENLSKSLMAADFNFSLLIISNGTNNFNRKTLGFRRVESLKKGEESIDKIGGFGDQMSILDILKNEFGNIKGLINEACEKGHMLMSLRLGGFPINEIKEINQNSRAVSIHFV